MKKYSIRPKKVGLHFQIYHISYVIEMIISVFETFIISMRIMLRCGPVRFLMESTQEKAILRDCKGVCLPHNQLRVLERLPQLLRSDVFTCHSGNYIILLIFKSCLSYDEV